VQFVETGRATYMFDRSHLTALGRCDAGKLYSEILRRDSIGRYTHHGYYWRPKAEAEVRRVLRQAGK
jgi:hypothetical protein